MTGDLIWALSHHRSDMTHPREVNFCSQNIFLCSFLSDGRPANNTRMSAFDALIPALLSAYSSVPDDLEGLEGAPLIASLKEAIAVLKAWNRARRGRNRPPE